MIDEESKQQAITVLCATAKLVSQASKVTATSLVTTVMATKAILSDAATTAANGGDAVDVACTMYSHFQGPRCNNERSFKDMYSLSDRLAETTRIKQKYPDRAPVICERAHSNTMYSSLDKKKFLIPTDLNCGKFTFVIRQRMKLNAEEAIYLYVDFNGSSIMVSNNELIKSIYMKYKDKEDGFLYIKYSNENVFG